MKKTKILSLVFIFLFLMLVSLFATTFGNDEIWNYGFAVSIYKGLIPYKDFNMVITPLYPFLMSLPFHIFGHNELVLQITNCLCLIPIFIILDKFFKDKKYIILLLFAFPLSIVFPSYNTFLLLLLIILLYCEEYKKNDFIIGLIIGSLFLTKQTVGGCILIPGILFYIKDIKKISKRIIGFIIPIIILVIYLVCNNAFSYFIDYCFLGLIDFGSKNTHINIAYIIIILVMIINALYYIKKNPKSIFNYYILAFYSIMLPLMDIYHTQIAFIACMVLNLYNLKLTDKYDKCIKAFSICTAIGVSIIVFISSMPYKYPNSINNFEYRIIKNSNIAFTKKVNNYVKKHSDKEFYYLVADAYYFRIINEENITKLDLINNGNIGYNGSKKIIKEIEKHKDALFIIYEVDFNEKSQIDKEALHYIKNNFKKVDSIGIYDVYAYDY